MPAKVFEDEENVHVFGETLLFGPFAIFSIIEPLMQNFTHIVLTVESKVIALERILFFDHSWVLMVGAVEVFTVKATDGLVRIDIVSVTSMLLPLFKSINAIKMEKCVYFFKP
jgi:hypothetical protein